MENVGLLLTKDIKLHRKWFNEMVSLIGIKVIHYAPKNSKSYNDFTELFSNYQSPEVIGCIFEEHPTQKTMKKLGWDSELQDSESIIHVAYDTQDIQAGSLFIIPSGIDCTKGRLFRATELAVGIIYPASITCKLVPEWEDDYSTTQNEFKHSSFNLLNNETSEIL